MTKKKAAEKIIRIVKVGLVYVDQGMGHGHVKLDISSKKCWEVFECLRTLYPRGKMRREGPILTVSGGSEIKSPMMRLK